MIRYTDYASCTVFEVTEGQYIDYRKDFTQPPGHHMVITAYRWEVVSKFSGDYPLLASIQLQWMFSYTVLPVACLADRPLVETETDRLIEWYEKEAQLRKIGLCVWRGGFIPAPELVLHEGQKAALQVHAPDGKASESPLSIRVFMTVRHAQVIA